MSQGDKPFGIKIKIKRCSEESAWYKDKIGQTVEMLGMDESYYWSRDDSGAKNGIMKQDGEIVKIER